ncbi:peptidase S41 [Sphingomonas sp. HHU CXW]|uniref:Peptidase S41 n=1 Tax=Sphingomonas hominis TaxID=2741495 RepID=A0ABX2JKG2_9SPHN|nr:S41 family peptidase [Sphingomonas hominis]NTS65970.1 peptidase S41 [Sphingomonas hominis]
MRAGRFSGLLASAALLASCGGGDGGGSGSGVPIASAPTPTPAASPTPTAAAGCSLRERQDWAFAQLNEWYLFPETLPASLSPAGYSTVDDYVDALTATARAQRKDRYFTYLTSIAEENAYYSAGASGGFGIRLGYDTTNRRVGIIEAFEGAPALAAGLDRGTEILAIGTSADTLRTTSDLIAANGPQGVVDALGPDNAGTTRVLRVSDNSGTRNVTLTKADFNLTPVSSRYGAKIITDNGMRVGYVNLRTFIGTADAGLRSAFQQFRDAGITNVIVDVRYNGGGSLSIAELFTDLLGGARSTNDVQSYITFRPSKASQNETTYFSPQPQSIAPTKIAFIGTGSTASASEYVINSMLPYLRSNVALIGSNTYGKPVGQIALDRSQCDDRLRVIALALQNASRQGDYYDGLATKVETSCQAVDDATYQMGDPREASTRAALNFLQGRGCTRIGATASVERATTPFAQRQQLLSPERPSTAQRETPGLF